MCKKRMELPQFMAFPVATVTLQDSDTRNAQQPKIMTNGLMFMGSMETLIISVYLEPKP